MFSGCAESHCKIPSQSATKLRNGVPVGSRRKISRQPCAQPEEHAVQYPKYSAVCILSLFNPHPQLMISVPAAERRKTKPPRRGIGTAALGAVASTAPLGPHKGGAEGAEIVHAGVWASWQVGRRRLRQLGRGGKVHLLAHEQMPVGVAVQDPHPRVVSLQWHCNLLQDVCLISSKQMLPHHQLTLMDIIATHALISTRYWRH